MKELAEVLVGLDLIFMGVVGYFLSIHTDRGHFNSSHEVGIVVAQVVRNCFKLILSVGA